jgi:phosphoadenosine phosphosulfate reductase
MTDRAPRPIAHAREVITRSGAQRVILALSGGKDSLCVAQLVVDQLGPDNVAAFYMQVVPGVRFEQKPVLHAARRLGIEVKFLPHWVGTEAIRKGMYRHGPEPEVPKISQVDIEEAARFAFDWDDAWIAHGHRVSDSLTRIAMLRKHDVMGVDRKAQRIYPIYEWSDPDVFGFLRARRIPLPEKLDRHHSMMVSLDGAHLKVIRERYPEDFALIKETFPFCEAGIVRSEQFAERERSQAHQVSEVRVAPDPSTGHQERAV